MYSSGFERLKIFQAYSKDLAIISHSYTTFIPLPKKINKISFSTQRYFKINPWFLTGFTDAEGSFIIKIQSNEQLKTR